MEDPRYDIITLKTKTPDLKGEEGMKVKKIAALGMAAAMTLAMTSTAFAEDTVNVGCVVKFQHEYYEALMQGAQDACDEYDGWEFTGMAPSSPDDIDGQVSMVEDMVTTGVDVLLVAPNQETTLYNAFDTAIEAGTILIAVDTDISGYEGKTAFCGTSNKSALHYAAELMSEIAGEGANVILIRGPLGDANHEARAAGATEGIEDTGMNLLAVKDCSTTAEGAASAMEDFIIQYQDEIDAVICCDDDLCAGAIQALRQAGYTDVPVSGFDGTAVGIQNVADGYEAFDLSQDPYNMGYLAVKTAYAVLNGEEYEENIDTGVQVITIDNYKDFQ